jgi:hypothetical protein
LPFAGGLAIGSLIIVGSSALTRFGYSRVDPLVEALI